MHEITARQGPRTGSFEFDEPQLRLICHDLVKKINQKFKNKEIPNFKAKLKALSPIDGKQHIFNFRVKFIPDENEYFNNAAATWHNMYQEIMVTVPSQFIWEQFTDSEHEQQYYRNIRHELTHAFDIQGNKNSHNGVILSTHTTPEELNKYYNDPAEVKAYLSQVHADIENEIRKNRFAIVGKRPEQVLELSQTWQVLKDKWQNNPKVFKMFLRAAFDIIQAYHS